jgi:glycosyltransferase involved in cell wall biosynthesis
MFWLSRGLVDRGHHVDLFYDSRRFGVDAGISIMPKGMKLSMLSCTDYDVLISWEDLESIEVFHRARKVVLAVQCNTLDMAARDVGVDIYQTVSNWHADELVRSDPSLQAREVSYRERLLVFPNGIDLARYANPPEREPFRIIHSSSPDRGLHHLLALWPRIKRQVPEATLHIYYDMKGWFDAIEHAAGYGVTDIITAPRAHDLQRLLKETEDQGVTTHGGIGQWELAQEQMKSSLMVYPCDPVRPTEGFSISILEGLAAGTPVITSNADALPELWADYTTQVPLPFEESHDELLAAIVKGLTAPRDEEQIASRQRFARTFDWRTLQVHYADFIERLVTE